jgi:hypothetical protein
MPEPSSATAPLKSVKGTVSKPGVTFTEDENTGLYSPGSDQLAVTVGGADAAKFTSTGLEIEGDLNLDDGGSFTTTLQTVTPTQDNTISFPDATGTVGLVAGSTSQIILNRDGSYAGLSTLTADTSGNVTLTGRFVSSLNGALSTTGIAGVPAALTGTWIATGGTATTTKPQFLIEPSGATSTAWSTAGTGLGVNAASGFAGRLLDLQLNGTSNFNVDSTGRASVPLGTAALPSIYPGTDTNTGLYSPGPDQLAISTNGTGRLFVAADGKVGVGDSSPEAALVIGSLGYSVTDRASALRLLDAGGTNGNNYGFGFDNTVGGFYRTAGNGGFHAWLTANTERLRITTAGRVGIGTTTPADKLHVDGGALRIQNGTDVSYAILAGRSTDGRSELAFRNNAASSDLARIVGQTSALSIDVAGSERARIDSSGRLGLGTSSPSYRFHLARGDAAGDYAYMGASSDGGQRGLIFSSADAGAFLGAIHQIRASSGSGELRFGTGTSDRLTIDSSGRVGIGTTTPGENLSVWGAGSNPGVIGINGGSGQVSRLQFKRANTNRFKIECDISDNLLFYSDVSGAERARIDSSGRLLVGTSTSTNNSILETNINAVTKGDGTLGGITLTGYNGTTSPTSRSSVLCFQRSRGTTDGSLTLVADGDRLGNVFFRGADGTSFLDAASIQAFVDGTPGANDMPGRLVFSTTADGASSPTERMRITSTGQVRLAGAGITFNGDTAAANELDDYEEGTFTPTLSATSINVTYSLQNGFYTKIGRKVFFTIQINLASVTSAGTGDFAIGGLPFAVGAAAYRYVIQTNNVDFDATKYSHYAYNPGGTILKVLYTADNGPWTVASTTNFAISSSSIISTTGFYNV